MKKERALLLAELLEEMRQDPNGFIPEEAWEVVQRTFALPYIELAVVRRTGDKIEVLLSYRADHWKGWHIPGSMWRTSKTLEEGISSVAKGELGLSEVKFLAKSTWDKWLDSPFGFPISLLVIVSSSTKIVETKTIRWFSEVPEDMIDDNGHHARFIKNVLRQVEEQKLV